MRVGRLWLAMALAAGFVGPGLARAGLFDGNVSAPPGSRSAPVLPPGEEDDVRRLLKAAEGLRRKADELRVRSDAAHDRNRDDQAEELDDRASELDEKARLFEDQADDLIRRGGRTGPADAGEPAHRRLQ